MFEIDGAVEKIYCQNLCKPVYDATFIRQVGEVNSAA